MLMSLQHPQVDKDKFSEMLFLKMGALTGLLVLLWSGNMLTAFIGLELASLSFYLLIALSRTGVEALKAGFKYFVLGSLAGLFCFTASLLFWLLPGILICKGFLSKVLSC